jgi:S1-C subfamily serine protease
MAMRAAFILGGLMILAVLPSGMASLQAQPSPSPATDVPPPRLKPGKQFGFGFQPVPEGVKIMIVAHGSAAERAGLAEGLVISQLNGIPLAALDMPRLAEYFRSAPDEVTLTILGKGKVKLRREDISDADRAEFKARVGDE